MLRLQFIPYDNAADLEASELVSDDICTGCDQREHLGSLTSTPMIAGRRLVLAGPCRRADCQRRMAALAHWGIPVAKASNGPIPASSYYVRLSMLYGDTTDDATSLR